MILCAALGNLWRIIQSEVCVEWKKSRRSTLKLTNFFRIRSNHSQFCYSGILQLSDKYHCAIIRYHLKPRIYFIKYLRLYSIGYVLVPAELSELRWAVAMKLSIDMIASWKLRTCIRPRCCV